MGEFGRTPKINQQQGPRPLADAWSTVLAGGGIKGGQVIGKTSADGMAVEERPVAVPDFLATVCMALGIDPRSRTSRTSAGPIRIVDPNGRTRQGGRSHEPSAFLTPGRSPAWLPAGPSPARRRAPQARDRTDLDDQDVVYFGDARPVLLRLHVAVDGQPLSAAWDDYVAKVFKHLDVNGDGVLSGRRCTRMPVAGTCCSARPCYGGSDRRL